MTDNQSQSIVNNAGLGNTRPLDFTPFGQVIGKYLTWDEVEQNHEDYIRSITKAPPLPASIFATNTCNVVLPIEIIQTTIEREISQIKQNFIDKSQREQYKYENYLFTPPLFREYPIKSINVIKKNPFYWIIEVKHQEPERLAGWPDTLYEVIKNDKLLSVTIDVRIYVDSNSQSDNEYHIYINRYNGRSHVYHDFKNNVTSYLEEERKKYKLVALRMPLIMLSEGLDYEKKQTVTGPIIKYLFNEYNIREICAYIG